MNKQSDNKKSVLVGLIIIFALLFLFAGLFLYREYLPVITLKVENVTIRQDEAIPKFHVSAKFSGEKDITLDEETGYKVSDLVNELNQGKWYQLSYNADNTTEGVYQLKLRLDFSLQEKLIRYWHFKVKCEVVDGTLEVLSKYGDWNDGSFTFFDGRKGKGWTNIGPETYYFNEEGKRVTGEQEICGMTYYFDSRGRFLTEKNRINPTKPMLALTFDDGPGKYTMQLLACLEKYNARATFFLVGTNVKQYPDTIKKMNEIACEIGNHTMHHARLTQLDATGILAELKGTDDAIKEIIGRETTIIRPTYGVVNEAVQSNANAPLILWSVDTMDWETKDVAQVRDSVLRIVKDGDIVLFHDIHETTVQAMLEVIPKLIEQGYQLVTVSEMAMARGVELQDGMIYYSFY